MQQEIQHLQQELQDTKAALHLSQDCLQEHEATINSLQTEAEVCLLVLYLHTLLQSEATTPPCPSPVKSLHLQCSDHGCCCRQSHVCYGYTSQCCSTTRFFDKTNAPSPTTVARQTTCCLMSRSDVCPVWILLKHSAHSLTHSLTRSLTHSQCTCRPTGNK